MTLSLFLLTTAAAAVIALAVSLGVFSVARASSRMLETLSPAAEARLLLCQALLPALATLALMTAAMAPSFGWIADHCTATGDVHHSHPHLCADHHVIGWPAVSVLALAGLFSASVLIRGVQVLRRALLAGSVKKALNQASSWDDTAKLRVLPAAEPQAFVVGIVSPTIYVTSGLLAEEHREHLAAVLAHERAHVLRWDPLKRLLCQIGLVFHVPGVARSIETRLARAQEMAADAAAAARVGSGERIALALVHLTRARIRLPQLVLPFGTSDLESRVRRLLLPPREVDFPGPYSFFAAGAVALAAIAASAGAVHHGIEMLLGLISG